MSEIKPKTTTPWHVYVGLLLEVVLLFWVMWWLFGNPLGPVVALIAMAVATKLYSENVPGYFARIVLDNLSDNQRVIFQGTHLTHIWETPTKNVDLTIEIKEVRGIEGNPETYATADGLVFVKYVYTISPDVTGSPKDMAENVRKWGSYSADAIKTQGRALFSQTFSDFFKTMTVEAVIVMGKETIQGTAFPDGTNGRINKFKEKYGAHVEVTLEDVDRDPALQAARDTIARAKSLGEAIAALRVAFPAISEEEAAKFIKLDTFPNFQEYSLDVRGLENLTHFSGILPTGGGGGKKGGDEKKGKKK